MLGVGFEKSCLNLSKTHSEEAQLCIPGPSVGGNPIPEDILEGRRKQLALRRIRVLCRGVIYILGFMAK
jgi:hypothetical protein